MKTFKLIDTDSKKEFTADEKRVPGYLRRKNIQLLGEITEESTETATEEAKAEEGAGEPSPKTKKSKQ
jgi:hypothetical protein